MLSLFQLLRKVITLYVSILSLFQVLKKVITLYISMFSFLIL
jgi:hypothetical protein